MNETFLWPHTKAFFYFNSKLLNETFHRTSVVTHSHFILTFFVQKRESKVAAQFISCKASFNCLLNLRISHLFNTSLQASKEVFTLKDDARSNQIKRTKVKGFDWKPLYTIKPNIVHLTFLAMDSNRVAQFWYCCRFFSFK